jgi:hypothetical protein
MVWANPNRMPSPQVKHLEDKLQQLDERHEQMEQEVQRQVCLASHISSFIVICSTNQNANCVFQHMKASTLNHHSMQKVPY